MSLAQSTGVIDETSAVRVKNVSDTRFIGDYANRRYVIEAGAEIIAPYHAAVYWFGDPRSRNIGEKRSTHYRDQEIARLSTLYGLFNDAFWDEYGDGNLKTARIIVSHDESIPPRDYTGTRHPNLPQVEVYDLGTGDRILTVIDDPVGNELAPSSTAEVESRALADQVKAMGEQLANLQRELAQRDPALAANTSIALDTPPPSEDAILAGLDEGLASDKDPVPDPDDPEARPTRDVNPRSAPTTPRPRPQRAK
jgi:hypothetical protein